MTLSSPAGLSGTDSGPSEASDVSDGVDVEVSQHHHTTVPATCDSHTWCTCAQPTVSPDLHRFVQFHTDHIHCMAQLRSPLPSVLLTGVGMILMASHTYIVHLLTCILPHLWAAVPCYFIAATFTAYTSAHSTTKQQVQAVCASHTQTDQAVHP